MMTHVNMKDYEIPLSLAAPTPPSLLIPGSTTNPHPPPNTRIIFHNSLPQLVAVDGWLQLWPLTSQNFGLGWRSGKSRIDFYFSTGSRPKYS